MTTWLNLILQDRASPVIEQLIFFRDNSLPRPTLLFYMKLKLYVCMYVYTHTVWILNSSGPVSRKILFKDANFSGFSTP